MQKLTKENCKEKIAVNTPLGGIGVVCGGRNQLWGFDISVCHLKSSMFYAKGEIFQHRIEDLTPLKIVAIWKKIKYSKPYITTI